MYGTFTVVDQRILETLVQTLARNQDAIVDVRVRRGTAGATLRDALHAISLVLYAPLQFRR